MFSGRWVLACRSLAAFNAWTPSNGWTADVCDAICARSRWCVRFGRSSHPADKHRSRLHGIIVICIFRLPPPSNLPAVGCTKTWYSLCLRPFHYQVCSGRPPLEGPRRASTLCIAAAAFSLRIRLHGPAFCNARGNEAGPYELSHISCWLVLAIDEIAPFHMSNMPCKTEPATEQGAS